MLPRQAGSTDLAAPSVDDPALALAMVEDVLDVLGDLAGVDTAVVVAGGADPAWREVLGELAWPGTPVVGVEAAGDGPALVAALAALAALGAAQGVVVAADAPDLPALLIGKLFRGLGSASVSVCPAAGGGLVALGSRLPVADWLTVAGVGLDTPDALAALAATAPDRAAPYVGPGWHRIRSAADLSHLDPGLEGWAATRAALTAGR